MARSSIQANLHHQIEVQRDILGWVWILEKQSRQLLIDSDQDTWRGGFAVMPIMIHRLIIDIDRIVKRRARDILYVYVLYDEEDRNREKGREAVTALCCVALRHHRRLFDHNRVGSA